MAVKCSVCRESMANLQEVSEHRCPGPWKPGEVEDPAGRAQEAPGATFGGSWAGWPIPDPGEILGPPTVALRILGAAAVAGNKTGFPFVREWTLGGRSWPAMGRDGFKVAPAAGARASLAVRQVEGGKSAEAVRRDKAFKARAAMTVRRAVAMGAPCLDGPVLAAVRFVLERPPSVPRSRTWPATRPDLSKYLRALEDRLVNPGTAKEREQGVLADDARIVAYVELVKLYADATPDLRPRVEVRLWPAVFDPGLFGQ